MSGSGLRRVRQCTFVPCTDFAGIPSIVYTIVDPIRVDVRGLLLILLVLAGWFKRLSDGAMDVLIKGGARSYYIYLVSSVWGWSG